MLLNLAVVGLAVLAEAGEEITRNPALAEAEDYIVENFDVFREKMRQVDCRFSAFSAHRIEESHYMEIVEDGKEGLFLDFDDDNGYALIGDQKEMLFFVPAGSLIRNSSCPTVYSRFDGFGYRDAEGRFCSYTANQKTVVGEDAKGSEERCGEDQAPNTISDSDAYVSSHYGTGFSLETWEGKMYWTYKMQEDYSVYRKNASFSQYMYEGNCQLASIYEALDYFRVRLNLTTLPSGMVPANPEGDAFYYSLISQRNSAGNPLYEVYHSSIPALYKSIRAWYIANDGYVFSNAHIDQGPASLSSLGATYGLNLSGTVMTSWTLSDVIPPLLRQISCDVFCQTTSAGISHAMPITGQKLYSKTTNWWIFQHKDYVHLLGVNDNFSYQQKYVDYSAGLSGSLLRISISL
jgi:hypothetical protein